MFFLFFKSNFKILNETLIYEFSLPSIPRWKNTDLLVHCLFRVVLHRRRGFIVNFHICVIQKAQSQIEFSESSRAKEI